MYSIRTDPNGPWHEDKESGEVWLVQGVRDREFLDYIEVGDIMIGDRIALYTPYSDDPNREDWAWTWFGIIKDLRDVSNEQGPYALVYVLQET